MGRTLTFLERIVRDDWSKKPREIAADGKSAVLIEPDGRSRVIGSGKGAYFLSVHEAPQVCREETPLTFRNIAVHHAPEGAEFNVKDWKGKGCHTLRPVGRGWKNSDAGRRRSLLIVVTN